MNQNALIALKDASAIIALAATKLPGAKEVQKQVHKAMRSELHMLLKDSSVKGYVANHNWCSEDVVSTTHGATYVYVQRQHTIWDNTHIPFTPTFDSRDVGAFASVEQYLLDHGFTFATKQVTDFMCIFVCVLP